MRTPTVAIWDPNPIALIVFNQRVSAVAINRRENPSDKSRAGNTTPPHG
jgi:hypothetical protein